MNQNRHPILLFTTHTVSLEKKKKNNEISNMLG